MRSVTVRVLNYLEFASRLERSGIATATRHQRAALETTDVSVITSPWRYSLPGPVREFDMAHLNLFGPGSLAIARQARQPERSLIVHAHVTSEDFKDSFRGSNRLAPVLRRYLRWFYSKADRVLCPSHHTKTVLESYPVTAPINVITNGVDHESLAGFESLREDYRSRFDLSGVVVFSVGNVFERKGLTTFCRLAQATDFDFVWFGPYDTGPHASPVVKEWVGSPPTNVTFTGWIDDKRGAFGAGDIFLFPTKAENQGIAVLEAMACGKAVVLRDLPVFNEYYTHEEDCLLCSSFTDFREALNRLAANPDLRDRLGQNARATAEEHRLENVGDRLHEIYGRTHGEVTTP